MSGAWKMPRDAAGLLGVTDETLGVVIGRAVGAEPDLVVISQSVMGPPHPVWAVPPLGARARLLVRRTSYRLGALTLSRNLAYVDLERLPSGVAADLESERVNLGQLFLSDDIEKSAFHLEVPRQVDRSLHEGYPEGPVPFDPCASRRYEAAIGGRVAFVVIESLPERTWAALLGAPQERARMLTLAGVGAT